MPDSQFDYFIYLSLREPVDSSAVDRLCAWLVSVLGKPQWSGQVAETWTDWTWIDWTVTTDQYQVWLAIEVAGGGSVEALGSAARAVDASTAEHSDDWQLFLDREERWPRRVFNAAKLLYDLGTDPAVLEQRRGAALAEAVTLLRWACSTEGSRLIFGERQTKDVPQPNHLDMIRLLASVLHTQGGEAALVNAATLLRKLLGLASVHSTQPMPHPTTTLMHSLASVLWSQSGEAAEAEAAALHRELLAFRRFDERLSQAEVSARVHAWEALETHDPASRVAARVEAATLLREVLEARREVLDERPMNNLVALQRLQEGGAVARIDEYLCLLVKNRTVVDECHGGTNIWMAPVLQYHGGPAALAEEAKLLHEALTVLREVREENHPDTLACKRSLARVLQSQNGKAAAEKLLQDVLAASKMSCIVTCHHDGARQSTAQPLACVHLDRGVFRLPSIPDFLHECFGCDHECSGCTMHQCRLVYNDTETMVNLASVLQSQGGNAALAAVTLYREVLSWGEYQDDLSGLRPPPWKTTLLVSISKFSMDSLASVLRSQVGDAVPAQAVTLYREVLTKRRAMLEEHHRDRLASMCGRLALVLHREELATRRARLGKHHRDTLASMRGLALVLQGGTIGSQGREDALADAKTLLHEALVVSRWRLGDQHQDTLTLMRDLASVLQAQGGEAVLLEEDTARRGEALAARRELADAAELLREVQCFEFSSAASANSRAHARLCLESSLKRLESGTKGRPPGKNLIACALAVPGR